MHAKDLKRQRCAKENKEDCGKRQMKGKGNERKRERNPSKIFCHFAK